jgi:arylsulfatase
VTRHRTPWILTGKTPPFDDDVWELYDTNEDWTQAHDLSKQMSEKLHELQRLWIVEATRNNVLPIDDRGAERFNSDIAGRPVLIRGMSQILARGMGGLTENSVVNIKNKSHAVTARVIVPEGKPSEGVILSQGGLGGGWVLYVKGGRLTYCYNFAGLQEYSVSSMEALSSGEHQLRMEFAYDGGGLGKGGTVTLYIDGKPVGSGRVEETLPMVLSLDETSNLGSKRGSPITPDVPIENNAFTGTVQLIVIEANPTEDVDHIISHEHLMHILMARQ